VSAPSPPKYMSGFFSPPPEVLIFASSYLICCAVELPIGILPTPFDMLVTQDFSCHLARVLTSPFSIVLPTVKKVPFSPFVFFFGLSRSKKELFRNLRIPSPFDLSDRTRPSTMPSLSFSLPRHTTGVFPPSFLPFFTFPTESQSLDPCKFQPGQ